MRTPVVTYHLEMTDPAALRPSRPAGGELEIRRAEIPCPELNRFLYAEVGSIWSWKDRSGWRLERWMEWLDRPGVETWVAYVRGTPAGYFELELQPDANVEIAYLGLLPRFVGRGFGGPLLTAALERAWAMGAARVWVHTCTLDHPGALANYQARGMRIFKEETGENPA